MRQELLSLDIVRSEWRDSGQIDVDIVRESVYFLVDKGEEETASLYLTAEEALQVGEALVKAAAMLGNNG
jgi:hypothetical protein